MRLLIPMLIVLVSGCASVANRVAATDVERIEAIIDDWNRAWTIKDPVLAASGYGAEAEFTNAFGFNRTGREEIEIYLTDVFGLDFVMAGQSREVWRDIQFLREDVAIVPPPLSARDSRPGMVGSWAQGGHHTYGCLRGMVDTGISSAT